MLGLLMRYYLYCTDTNHDLDVGLMYHIFVQCDCAHLNYTVGQGQYKRQGQYVLSRALTARAGISN